MKILADESVNNAVVTKLRAAGFEVLAIAESSPGVPDRHVLQLAREQKAFLLTADRDFGELIFRHRLRAAGVLLLRLGSLTSSEQAELVANTLGDSALPFAGHFSVLTPRLLRSRPL